MVRVDQVIHGALKHGAVNGTSGTPEAPRNDGDAVAPLEALVVAHVDTERTKCQRLPYPLTESLPAE